METCYFLNVTVHILKLTWYSLWSSSFNAFAYTDGVPAEQATDKAGINSRQLGEHQEPSGSDHTAVTLVPFLNKHFYPLKLHHDQNVSHSFLPPL